MTAEQWTNIYAREKEKNGVSEAAITLMEGMGRELISRTERMRSTDPAEHVLIEVDSIWRHVASKNPELLPDGFKNYAIKLMPEAETLFNQEARNAE